MDILSASMAISGSALEAQSVRLKIVSENLANSNTTGTEKGSDPYQRKTITFASVFDKALGVNTVKVQKIGLDQSAFKLEHEPNHPAADENGFVKRPNVSPLLEMADMRETSQSYEANVQALKQARSLVQMSIDMMRG